MKVFFPRNIPGWWLNMSVQIGPAQVSIVQLMLMAVGMWLSLALANAFIRNGASNAVWFIIALPIFVLFIFVAFFKYSELRLHEFIAKMIRTHFLDATKKYQLNRTKIDPITIALAKARKAEHDVLIEKKNLTLDQEKLDRMNVLHRD